MEKLIMILQLLSGLSILVIVHEFGHFIAARAFGMRVEKFYLFFDAYGKKLFSFKRGDTEYGIGWLPLGGYVKISGMVDESMDKEQMDQAPEPWEFRSKPAWQRLIVMLGGVILNVVLGYLIFTGSLNYFGEQKILTSYVNDNGGIAVPDFAKSTGFETGDKIIKVNGNDVPYFNDIIPKYLLFSETNTANVIRNGEEIEIKLTDNFLTVATEANKQPILAMRSEFSFDSVVQDGPAFKAGFLKDDIVLSVNNKEVQYFDEFAEEVTGLKNKTANLTIIRGKDTLTRPVQVDSTGKIMVSVKSRVDFTGDTLLTYGFRESLKQGFSASKEALVQQAIGIKSLILGRLNFMKSVSSPIGIAKIYGATFDWRKFWYITGLLSFVLAIMNLLPIPALDGGHVVFLLIEMLRGKPLSDKFMMRAQTVGFVIILSIMMLAVFSDIFIKK